jgi:hypothetical protein
MTEESKPTRAALIVLFVSLISGAVFLFAHRPIPQPLSYHHFADQRTWCGIPNCMDVMSNLPFLVIGLLGLLFTLRPSSKRKFLTGSHRWSYVVFFAGVGLTFFGSCYYHLRPTNARLVWDRLPMTLGFMGLLSATLIERIDRGLGKLLLPMVFAGCGSVVYWNVTENLGRGDLRPYLFVQFGSLLAISAMLVLFQSPYENTWYMAIALAFYASAKLLETFDRQVLDHIYLISGHSLKHLAAGAGTYFILLMLEQRHSPLYSTNSEENFVNLTNGRTVNE